MNPPHVFAPKAPGIPAIGSGSGALGVFPTGQVVSTAISVVGMLLGGIFNRHGKQNVAATQIVEEVIRQLQENKRAYFSLPVPRRRVDQAAALANFGRAWVWLTSSEGCGNPQLGDSGRRCISERQPGGRYDMWRDLRDPIANDPDVGDWVDELDSSPWVPYLAVALIAAGLLL